MDPQTVFCHNLDCPARGQIGKGNIGVHSQKERRYICHVCKATFSEWKGTVFYRLRTSKDLVILVVTLLAHGCPIQAIVIAFGLDERTVVDWQERSGQHCEKVHEHLVERPRDLGQRPEGTRGDEIRVKVQGGVVWMAMALQVRVPFGCRLWLGGVLSTCRDTNLITALMQKVRACALCRPLLFCMDGCQAYIQAIHSVFREPIRTGKVGSPRMRPWDGILMAQVVKQYAGKRVVAIQRRLVQGTMDQVQALLQRTQGGGTINTAYIERLNATFRSRIAALVRRGRALARQTTTLHRSMYVVGSVYNFCTYHRSLRVAIPLPRDRRHWVSRTPAMAAGLTDHRWTVEELLSFRVPLPRWTPPRRRGRPSRATKALVERWCT